MAGTEAPLGRQLSSFIYLKLSMTEGTGRSHKLSLGARRRITATVFTLPASAATSELQFHSCHHACEALLLALSKYASAALPRAGVTI
jgi:hypothetical protein